MGTISEYFHYMNLPREKESESENRYSFITISPSLKTAKAKYLKGLKAKSPKMEEEIVQGNMFD